MLRHARWLARAWLLVAAPLVVSRAAAGQDTAAVRRPPAPAADTTAGTAPVTRADSLALRTSPMNAFWRSFLIPGWGQAKLGRKLTGGLFVAWEGTTLAMSLKTRHELAYLRRTNSARADDKRREHEDWLVLLGFNHLFAGLEAYVSAHLSDFPGDLRLQAAPHGIGGSVSVPFRLR
ncbi:MAG TPA: hypothetical protein VFN08_15845 [Gemmatimonadales bacterium]|nr:hypothetical protein [Gemmatimonadales bacterium]